MKNKICILPMAGILVLASCGTKSKKEAVFYMGTTEDIKEAVYGEYNYDMLASGISEMPLIMKTEDGRYEGLLATVETDDFITFTYTVKDGMCWSDGVKVTAGDILFTLEYEDETSGAHNFKDLDKDGTITKKKYASYSVSEDDKSITLTLESKNIREMSDMTTLRIVPSHIFRGNENLSESELRITSGPFYLESFDSSSGILKYTKNEYYPYESEFSDVYVKLYSTEDTMYQELMDNTLDMVWNYSKGVSETYYDVLDKAENVTLASKESENIPISLTFNNSTGVFKDKNIRLAVSYLLDYEKIRDTLGTKNSTLSSRGFVPPATMGYKEEEDNSKNEKKAEEYLILSGYEKNSSGMYEKNGTVLSFTLTVNSSKANHVRAAEMVKTELEKEGIEVNLEELDSLSYNAKTSNKFSGGSITMEAAIYGYTAAGMGMGSGLGTIYMDASHSVQGGAQVNDTEFLTIEEGLSNAKTPEEYNSYAGRLQDYYSENSPAIALYWDALTCAYSSSLKGVGMDAVFGINNIRNWSTYSK